jgi:hypothetical protein
MIFIYEDDEKINTFNNFNFYKQPKFNKTYNLLNDVYDIKLANEDVIFSLEIIKNETIKINELIIPAEITKYLKDIYVTINNDKVCNKYDYTKKIISTFNNALINIVFDKSKMDEIMNKNIEFNYMVLNKKNKSKNCLIGE